MRCVIPKREFVKGQDIICIDNKFHIPRLTKGKVYNILRVDKRKNYRVYIINDEGQEVGYWWGRFTSSGV